MPCVRASRAVKGAEPSMVRRVVWINMTGYEAVSVGLKMGIGMSEDEPPI